MQSPVMRQLTRTVSVRSLSTSARFGRSTVPAATRPPNLKGPLAQFQKPAGTVAATCTFHPAPAPVWPVSRLPPTRQASFALFYPLSVALNAWKDGVMKEFCSSAACSQGLTQAHLAAGAGAASPWQQVLFHRLRYEFALLTDRRDHTRQTEIGLEMPQSAYWFIGRIEPEYTSVVTLSELGASSPSGRGRVSPFDTGGLWHDKMKTVNDPLSPEQKRALYNENLFAVGTFDPSMSGWLNSAFSGIPADYCRDVRPTHHYVELVVLDDDSEARDWSWELSIDINAGVEEFPMLRTLYMNEYLLDTYKRWVNTNPTISGDDALDHLSLLNDIAIPTPQPYTDARLACEEFWLAAAAS